MTNLWVVLVGCCPYMVIIIVSVAMEFLTKELTHLIDVYPTHLLSLFPTSFVCCWCCCCLPRWSQLVFLEGTGQRLGTLPLHTHVSGSRINSYTILSIASLPGWPKFEPPPPPPLHTHTHTHIIALRGWRFRQRKWGNMRQWTWRLNSSIWPLCDSSCHVTVSDCHVT